MSPSQWQLSGSCLPLLCSLVHTLRMPHFKGDLKIQVRTQNENAKLFNQSQYFTIWLGRTAFRATVFATDGTARTASLRRQPTKPSKNQIESSSVCTETGESRYQVNNSKRPKTDFIQEIPQGQKVMRVASCGVSPA